MTPDPPRDELSPVMSCTYDFIVTRHTVDGIKLGVRSSGPVADMPLVLVATQDPGSAISFGCVIDEDYSGLGGLLHYTPEDLGIELEHNGSAGLVIFPSVTRNGQRPYGELLDSLRNPLARLGRVRIVMNYHHLAQDLPPLAPDDTVTLFWEIRDLLDEPALHALKIIRRQMDAETFEFRGMRFYTRAPAIDPSFNERHHEISRLIGQRTSPELLRL